MRNATFTPSAQLTIAVTGSRGLVGSELLPFLLSGGHKVVRLVTGKGVPATSDGTRWVNWNPAAPLDPAVLEGVDAVIHLAGESVASSRWSDAKKREIMESRTAPTRNLAAAIAALPAGSRPKSFVCASAVGFYGNRGDEVLTEDSARGDGFFPEVCKAWEDASAPARDAGVRTTNLRIGVVLSARGGALAMQLPAFKMGFGAVLGSGKQWVPWIAIGDLVGAIHHCVMHDTISGPVNATAPEPVTNHTFTKSLGKVLRRPAFLWLPPFMLRVLFGGIADDGLLTSLRAVPKKLLDTGFVFDHIELVPALRFLLGR